MKVSPVFNSINCQKPCNNGQKFSSINFNHYYAKQNCEDVFIRLADASLKDKKIEFELKSMGLI